MPQACMAAYMVVGPTHRKPRRLSTLLSSLEAGVSAGTSAGLDGRGRSSANDHMRASRQPGPSVSCHASSARALPMAASILPR